jgi:D-glycero-D-manno-heptose 1,7-bisphosphate phosphatase
MTGIPSERPADTTDTIRALTNRAIFLDRDGTLILDTGYPSDPDEVVLLPGVSKVLRAVRDLGFQLVIISNQSGIGRGLVGPEQAALVQARVESLLAGAGVRFEAVYACPHVPSDRCRCRKPSPGLIFKAQADLDLDLANSVMIGDKLTDVQAGKAAGCRTILFRETADQTADEPSGETDAICRSWDEIKESIAKLAASNPA